MEPPFVYEYWSRTEFGRKMIASESVSYSDLLFMIPNNVKRIHHLPAIRIAGRNKARQKRERRRHILAFKLWDLISETIDNVLGTTFESNEFFSKFVDFKKLDLGYKQEEWRYE